MPALAALVLAGAGLGVWQPIFSSASAVQICFVPLIGLAGWLGSRRAAAFVLALAFASFDMHLYRADRLDPQLSATDMLIAGHVADLPRNFAMREGQRFDFRVAVPGSGLPRRVRLSWYDVSPIKLPGECWQLLVRLKPPLGVVNYGGYDRERDLLTRGIGARGYVRASPLNRPCAGSAPRTAVHQLRARFAAWLGERLAGEPALPLLQGITVGVRGSISAAQWELLRATGTAHLLAISGLHVGMLAASAWFLTAALLRAGSISRHSWLVPAASACAAVLYATAAGFALPTLRAVAMLLTALLLRAARRCWTPGDVVSGVLGGFVLCDATMLLTGSFWLSFCAVVLLINCARGWQAVDRPGIWQRGLLALRDLLKVQWVLGIGLAPLLIVLFGQVSLVAPLANLVAVPLFALVILPLTLAGIAVLAVATEFGVLLLQFACRLLGLLMQLLEALSAYAPLTWSPGPVSAAAAGTALSGGAMLLLPRPIPRLPLAAVLLGMAVVLHLGAAQAALRIEVLDVGQGLAVLIETAQRAVLVDTGPAWQGGDAGSRVVLPALRRRGISRLDALVVSHADADHSGGLAAILAALPVTDYYDARNCRRGMGWQWGQTRFSFLHPYRPAGWSENNASCVLLIEHAGSTVLLPGDIERSAERVVLARDNLANIDVLVAPHHGSRTSSSAAFVARLRPRFVIFATGSANRWGFPHPEIVERFQGAGACVLNTAASGAIVFEQRTAGALGRPRAARSRWARPWVLRTQTLC